MRDQLIDFYSKYASASTAFLTLYRDYKHFEWSNGQDTAVIAYVETPTAWIGASDPVGDKNLWLPLIDAFGVAARARRKDAVILPVSQELAEQLRAGEKFVVQIGTEPWFHLDGSITRSDRLRALPVARQLSRRGARITEFQPSNLSADEFTELESLNARWLGSRLSVPLGFLNRLDPWALMKFKKYFMLMFEGQIYGYLAAVPTQQRKAWYLVDLIRDPEAPLGTTELLIIEAIAHLERQGVTNITLGMAPLAGLSAAERSARPKLYSALDFIFRRGNSVYGFQSLHAYKEKFSPNEWRPLFLVSATARVSWRAWYGLFRAIYPGGFARTLTATLAHSLKKPKLRPFVEKLLPNELLARPLPSNWLEAISRMPITLALIATNIMVYVLTMNNQGKIRSYIKWRYVYSWNHMFHAHSALNSLATLVLPGLLHWNLFHLSFNLVLLFTLVAFCEVIIGSTVTCIAFLAGSMFSNVLTSLAMFPMLKLFWPAALPAFLNEVDIGCSLGIFSCIGATAYMTKYRGILASAVIVSALLGCITTGVALEINHVTAFAIGFFIASRFIT